MWEENLEMGYHVEKLNYYYSKEHYLVGLGIDQISIDNIGKNGENLTIAILSMNRASLTIRLMESIQRYIPDFAGEFLIGDNGSEEEEKEKLRTEMGKMPFRCRMLEFGKNYGVAGGRNRLFKEVDTEWILSADNDLYFVGNPLKKIQSDIGVLGCHFLTIPIVNKKGHGTGIYGGHLYVENLFNKIGIGGSSLYFAQNLPLNMENPPFLSTFLPGGASVIKKSSFFEMNGFDDNMFVGFEDVEFSVRLYQRGIKVGCTGIVSVIHDHPKPEISADIHYEKKRFSTDKLKESGIYFEKKHGFSAWNITSEEWVKKRLSDLSIIQDTEEAEKRTKKKVALLIDRPGWALDNIASQIEKYISDEFEIKKIYQDTIDCLPAVFLSAKECDIIHFLWRPLVTAYDDEYSRSFIHKIRMTEAEFYDRYIHDRVVSTAVYDHFFLGANDKEYTYKLFSDEKTLVDYYSVSSEKLYYIYNNDETIEKKPLAVITDGVDCKLFHPINEERFKNIGDRIIRIGWVGNSKWHIKDLKGINTLIKPVVETLKNKGYNVELVTSDRNEQMIPHNEMPNFYSSIDVYICASLCEGTPNPVLEAMACGIPVITTDVGIVNELFGPLQKNYILGIRTEQCLLEKLEYLLNHKEEFEKLSEENLNYIRKWDWSLIAEKFREYFRKCLFLKGRKRIEGERRIHEKV